MRLVGSRGQRVRDALYDASGTITAGSTAQLVLPETLSRSFLLLQNLSPGPLYVEMGAARVTCSISSGAVTSGGFIITNAGFGYTYPPAIEFLGGGNSGNTVVKGVGQPTFPAPGDPWYGTAFYHDLSSQKPAKASAILTGGAVTSIVLESGGSGYNAAPFMFLRNSMRDPNGCAIPSATSGILLPAQGQALIWNGTTCPTDPIAIVGGTTGQAFTCKWMD